MDGAEPVPPVAPRLLVSLIASCSFLSIGCREARLSELPGKYVVKADFGNGTLILNADHTTDQQFATQGVATEHVRGTWKFDGDFLTLTPCIDFKPDAGASIVGGCSRGVSVTLSSEVEISVDSQHGLAYRKVSGR
jgi:hypothetical protein